MMPLEDTLYPLRRLYEAAPPSLRALAGRIYRWLPSGWRMGPAYEWFAAEALASEAWDEEARLRYQITQIKASLRAAAKSPFHARRFARCGLNPAAFEALEQLADYPLLTKEDLTGEREAMVNVETPKSARLFMTTGGSSGVPAGFYLHKGVSRPKEQAYLETQWRRRGYQLGDRVAVLRGSTASGNRPVAWLDAARNWLVLSSAQLTVERLPEYLDALNRFKPRHLHAYPSSVLLLARLMMEARARLDFGLASVLCGSEKLSGADQAWLERFFEAPVFHWYGHSERVVLAGQGARCNHLYVWPGYGYAELGPPDEAGRREIIGTSFHNEVMPLIRYRTGDYVEIPEKPHGELPMLEIAAVAGRGYEFLVSAEGRRVSLTAINRHDEVFDGLLAVQFAQNRPGEVEVRFQAGARWRSVNAARMESALRVQLGEGFRLRFKQVDTMEKTQAGKHRWLVTSLAAGGWS